MGEVLIRRIVDLEDVPFLPTLIFPDAEKEEFHSRAKLLGKRHFSDDLSKLLLSFHSFLIQTTKANILVDTCCGNDKDRPTRPFWHMRRGPFLENLSKVNIKPEDIDYVMCTHLHADHIGWNTKLENGTWKPTFPNAEYLFAEKEFRFWKDTIESNPLEKFLYGAYDDSILPVISSGQAKIVRNDHDLGSGIFMEPAFGHTPGNIMVNVLSNNFHASLCGDVLHHPIQLFFPKWYTNFCSDPQKAVNTRLNFLKNCANTNTIVLPAHFQSFHYGKIESDENSYIMNTD